MFSERTRSRLDDIVENADAIGDYVAGLDLTAFLADRKTRDAVERCLERIIEAVIQIGGDEVERIGLDVPWRQMRGLGNRMRHEYQRIDQRIIYETIVTDLPPLRMAAARLLE